MLDDSEYHEQFILEYLPCFTEYFSKTQMEKTIISYKYLIEDLKRIEKVSTEEMHKQILSKKINYSSKKAKNLCRNGIQYKYMHDIILKIFNIQFSPEDYNNKAKLLLKDYSFSELGGACPSFSQKTFDEVLSFHYLNEKGISALKEITWLLNSVLPKIDYCPSIICLGSLLLLFLSKEETYEVLRTIIETDNGDIELNRLRWHFRYTIQENIQMEYNIKTCITELTEYNQQFNQFEKMGFNITMIIRDMFKNFFLDYINFIGITRILPFFLLEGIKGIYRFIYALLYTYNLSFENDKKNGKNISLNEKTQDEIFALLKVKSNRIIDFTHLMSFALKWDLNHVNNNYIYQIIPPSIKKNTSDINNLIHIPYFKPDSSILGKLHILKLWELLPIKFRVCNCTLLFKKEKKEEEQEEDLNTIYENFEELNDNINIFFVIQTDNDEIFGFIMHQNIKLDENIEYKPVHLSYLFSISPELKLYTHKDKNDNIVCFEPGAIRFGYGDDGPAISINYDLNEGITEKNTVFGENICLIKDYSNDGVFNIKNLEIYLMQ